MVFNLLQFAKHNAVEFALEKFAFLTLIKLELLLKFNRAHEGNILIDNVNINYEWKQNLFKMLNFNLAINNIFNNKYCSNAWVYKALVGGTEYIEDGYFPQAGINFMFGIIVEI